MEMVSGRLETLRAWRLLLAICLIAKSHLKCREELNHVNSDLDLGYRHGRASGVECAFHIPSPHSSRHRLPHPANPSWLIFFFSRIIAMVNIHCSLGSTGNNRTLSIFSGRHQIRVNPNNARPIHCSCFGSSTLSNSGESPVEHMDIAGIHPLHVSWFQSSRGGFF